MFVAVEFSKSPLRSGVACWFPSSQSEAFLRFPFYKYFAANLPLVMA